ncbi:MAG: HDIG domain-containing protein [Thermoanaerobacteraceae bacterium]|nr:HDIG domain-containing protein [Thermoanaerobacteraceae bacterium]
MNRKEALQKVQENVFSRNLIDHMIATEAIMRGLARRLGQDEEKWALTGLLHDIDYEQTADNPEAHSLIGAEMLEKMGLDDELTYAVKVHNEIHGLPRISLLDKALYAADPLSGLITAVAMVMPSKKLEDVKVSSIKKKFKDKAFARGANREQIQSCEELGLTMDEFFEIALEEMKKIAGEIGL